MVSIIMIYILQPFCWGFTCKIPKRRARFEGGDSMPFGQKLTHLYKSCYVMDLGKQHNSTPSPPPINGPEAPCTETSSCIICFLSPQYVSFRQFSFSFSSTIQFFCSLCFINLKYRGLKLKTFFLLSFNFLYFIYACF